MYNQYVIEKKCCNDPVNILNILVQYFVRFYL